jgi:uncharacterized protein YkwD
MDVIPKLEKTNPMRRQVALSAIVLWTASTLAQPPKPDDKKPAFKLSKDEQAVLDLTNAERKKANVPALKPNELLTKAAREHSANMAKQKKLDHVLDDKAPDARVKAVGYNFAAMAENVAMGQQTPAEAIATWMSSEAHKTNLLNAQYTEIGMGIAADADGQRYWTQVFGTPAPR